MIHEFIHDHRHEYDYEYYHHYETCTKIVTSFLDDSHNFITTILISSIIVN